MISQTTPSLGFYIHHHGSGHMMRAITIAALFTDTPVIFMGSNLQPFRSLIPERITCVQLPQDLPLADEDGSGSSPEFLHYAPLGISGIRSRMAMMAGIFEEHAPMLLIVDVSVEVALFARLCSIPTVIIRQHGSRADRAHLAAYESADLLLAPFSASMAPPQEEQWLYNKTLFAGGFSRFGHIRGTEPPDEQPQWIAILVGEGGSSIDIAFVLHLAAACPEFIFHVAGPAQPGRTALPANVVWHGKISQPEVLLRRCALVIGNAGHNTVMEMADLNKRFICIPESRPFDEQLMKAALLERDGHARVIHPHSLYNVNWQNEFTHILAAQPCWEGVTDPAALQHIHRAIAALLLSLPQALPRQ